MADTTTPDLTGSSADSGTVSPSLEAGITGGSSSSGVVSPNVSGDWGGGSSNTGALSINIQINTLTGVSLSSGSVGAPLARFEACGDTVASIRTELRRRTDDDGSYFPDSECLRAINVAQRFFCLVTLCLEKTASFTLTNNVWEYKVSAQFSDFIAPLRVSRSAGRRLIPDKINTWDCQDAGWRLRTGQPVRYAQMGMDLLAIRPYPASGGGTLNITYARVPADLVNDGDIPEVQVEQIPHIVDIAHWILMLKVGGLELGNIKRQLDQALEGIKKFAAFMRARSFSLQYDQQPLDEATFDKARQKLMKILEQMVKPRRAA